ncbi:MAG: DNA polymerase III subunit epsilon [Bacteroidetes bacterium GWE2_29_8]|nr:MAG: DNA polymerase III subunit epsilon [Bacteroidetes bacterium GWE2_29_8]
MQLKLNKSICFFDLETTGLEIAKDKIVEISILKLKPDNYIEEFYELLNPEIPIPSLVSKIHGIYDKDVVGKRTFKEAGRDIANFIGNSDLSGYNCLKFDVPMLVEEFMKNDIDFDLKGKRIVDVQNIFHKMESRTLRAAYKFYCNKELIDAHTAKADTRATYEILISQIDRYKDAQIEDANGKMHKPFENDVQSLHDFSNHSKFVDFAGHIILNDKKEEVFNFGKNKGRTVAEVFEKEPQYYDWMMKSDFPLYTKKIITELRLKNKGLI